MNFEDEHYVRIYTRDTKTWLRWGWEGQCVFMATMRKLDKAGILDVDDPIEDVALVTGLPVEIVTAGLPRVLRSGTFEVRNGRLVCPRYIEGQTAAKSDAQRMREHRERRRAEARGGIVTNPNGSVTGFLGGGEDPDFDPGSAPESTPPDEGEKQASDTEPNGAVTNPNATVTTCSDLFANADQRSTEQKKPPTPSEGEDSESEDAPTDAKVPEAPTAGQTPRVDPDDEVVTKVFDFWKREHNHPKAKLERKRRNRIKARLREGFTGRDLCLAIRGARKDPFLMGENDGGKVYDGLSTILRDAEQVERLIALAGSRRSDGSGTEAPPDPAGQARLARLEAQAKAQHEAAARELEQRGAPAPTRAAVHALREGIGG